MVLKESLVDAFRRILLDPKAYDLDIRPLATCLKESPTVTAKHKLWEQLNIEYKESIPKVIIYILLNEFYGPPCHKDESGNLGYHLEFVPSQVKEMA